MIAGPAVGTRHSSDDLDATPFSLHGDLPWVSVSPNGRYLITDDGRPFIPIGNQPGTGFLDLSAHEIDAHFARMQRSGENVVRIDFDYVYAQTKEYRGLESKPGLFNREQVEKIDTVFRLAAKHGIRVHVVPFVTSPPMWESWKTLNPYGEGQGGPTADPHDFAGSPQARQLYAARLEAISRRWGRLGTFFGWDLMNEADVLTRNRQVQDAPILRSWLEEQGTRLLAFEKQQHGRNHLQLMSYSDMTTPTEYDFFFTSPALNVAATHPYDFYGTDPAILARGGRLEEVVTSFVGPALEVNRRMREILGTKIRDRRPYMENERHQNNQTMFFFHRNADRMMMWSELASGAAGTGITWLVPSEFAAPPGADNGSTLAKWHQNLGPDRKAMRTFVNRIPAQFFIGATTDESLDSLRVNESSVAVMSTRRARYAIGWIVDRDDACLLAQSVNEVRQRMHERRKTGAGESVLALVLWHKILAQGGIQLPLKDDVAVVLEVFKMKLKETRNPVVLELEVLRAIAPVFERFEAVEKANGTLSRRSICPEKTVPVQFALPAGKYIVEWVNDRTGEVVRSDALSASRRVVGSPSFRNSLGIIVKPTHSYGSKEPGYRPKRWVKRSCSKTSMPVDTL